MVLVSAVKLSIITMSSVKTSSFPVTSRLTWARRARADDVDNATSVTARPEIAVAVGRPCQNVVATMHWTPGWL